MFAKIGSVFCYTIVYGGQMAVLGAFDRQRFKKTIDKKGVIPLALLSGLPLSRIVRVALVPNFIM